MVVALLGSFLITVASPQGWTPPYESVASPKGYEKLVSRLDSTGTGVFAESGYLTLLSKGEKNALVLPDWSQLKFVRDDAHDLWVAQAKMKDCDRSFFTYAIQQNGQTIRRTFRGDHAPKLPVKASKLLGSLQTFPITSKELGEDRNVTVYLPPNPGPKLNAVYMADGQSCEAYAKVLEPLILAKRVAPTAIIGLFHGEFKGDIAHYDMTQDFRAREYLKIADPDRFESHLRFVTQEVMPWAEGKFGLATEASNRALFGFSNGAAFAVVASVERPDLFANVLPFSVAVFDKDELGKSATNKRLPHYWLVAGTLETFIQNTKTAEAILKAARASVRRAEYVAGHDGEMWQLGFAQFMPKVFPAHR